MHPFPIALAGSASFYHLSGKVVEAAEERLSGL